MLPLARPALTTEQQASPSPQQNPLFPNTLHVLGERLHPSLPVTGPSSQTTQGERRDPADQPSDAPSDALVPQLQCLFRGSEALFLLAVQPTAT